jgi:DNA topoisomerase-3
VKENYKKFACQQCDWSTWKIVAGRQFEIGEIETLLREGRIGPLLGFRNRMGRLFNAEVILNDEKQPVFDFGQPKEGEAAEAVDFSGQETVGVCPKCQARVFEHGMAYVCEKSTGPEKSCDFRSGKIILQQPVEREQMQKLLAEGKTDLLRGFISARTKRKFSAFLVRGKDGKVGFEFEPRAPKAKAKAETTENKTAGEKKAPAKRAAKKKEA